MTDHYAVIGNPIKHSRSPEIHNLFAQQTNQDIVYERILGEPGQFVQHARTFLSHGGKGLNVTVPFKEDAWKLADELGNFAESVQAVNTLILLPDGRLRGENTDGIGLVRDITLNHDINLKGLQVLILGAGGASRGVIQPLLRSEPAGLTIANRTAAKAVRIVQQLSNKSILHGCGLDQLAGKQFDLIINATSAGLVDEVPQIPDGLVADGGCCYDMMYGCEPTAFVSWGRKQGATKSLDGLGMLVEQAAESFYLWRGVRPNTKPVIQALMVRSD